MLTIGEAFEKFKSRLEISASEQKDASQRQLAIREHLRRSLAVQNDFLTGSYARDTKTRPLKDVDIFVVLQESEANYLGKAPDVVLDRFIEILSLNYGGRIEKGNRSVKIDFGDIAVADEQIMSVDIVPAFARGDAYLIPDRRQRTWITANPRIHAEMATAANATFSKQWKPIVKMVKKWNDHNQKPVKPTFLLEVMALELLDGSWGGSYPRELRQFFASAASRLDEEWPDPAGLGPPVTARLSENTLERNAAIKALRSAEAASTEALRQDREGRIGAALDTWQELLGPRFAKS